jgi:hypothetical protein
MENSINVEFIFKGVLSMTKLIDLTGFNSNIPDQSVGFA